MNKAILLIFFIGFFAFGIFTPKHNLSGQIQQNPRLQIPGKKPGDVKENSPEMQQLKKLVDSRKMLSMTLKKGLSAKEQQEAVESLDKALSSPKMQAEIRRDRTLSKFYADYLKLSPSEKVSSPLKPSEVNTKTTYWVLVKVAVCGDWYGGIYDWLGYFDIKPADRKYLDAIKSSNRDIEPYLKKKRIRLPR